MFKFVVRLCSYGLITLYPLCSIPDAPKKKKFKPWKSIKKIFKKKKSSKGSETDGEPTETTLPLRVTLKSG